MSNLKIDRLQLEIIINNDQARKSLRALEDESRQLKKDLKKVPEGSDEWKRINTRLKSIQVQHDKIIEKLGLEKLTIRELTQRQRELNAVMRNLDPSSKGYKDLAKQLSAVKNRMAQLRGAAQRTSSSIKKMATGFTRSFGSMLGVTAFIYGVKRAFGDVINRIREFDKAMQNMAGIAQTSRRNLKDVEQTIRKVASDSLRTSNQVAELATVLFTLGKTKKEVIQMLKPVNDLSIALGSASADTADFLGQTLNAFGKGAGSAQRFADIVANIRGKTALNFERIQESFGFLVPTAKALKMTIGGTGAVIGILQNNGVKAARAGRLLNTSFAKLVNKGLTLNQALQQINNSTNKVKTASDLFGARAFSLGLILAENIDKTKKLAYEFDNMSKGSLKKLTDEQLESMDAKMKILNSTWENFILGIDSGNGFISKSIRGVVSVFTGLIRKLNDLNGGNDKYASSSAEIVKTTTDNGIEVNKLVGRYNELIKIAKPNRKEQGELEKIIKRINILVPDTTSAIDKYGKALKINTGYATGFYTSQKKILDELLKLSVPKIIADLKTTSTKIKKLQSELLVGRETSLGEYKKLTAVEQIQNKTSIKNLKQRKNLSLELLRDSGVKEGELVSAFAKLFVKSDIHLRNVLIRGIHNFYTKKYNEQIKAGNKELIEQKKEDAKKAKAKKDAEDKAAQEKAAKDAIIAEKTHQLFETEQQKELEAIDKKAKAFRKEGIKEVDIAKWVNQQKAAVNKKYADKAIAFIQKDIKRRWAIADKAMKEIYALEEEQNIPDQTTSIADDPKVIAESKRKAAIIKIAKSLGDRKVTIENVSMQEIDNLYKTGVLTFQEYENAKNVIAQNASDQRKNKIAAEIQFIGQLGDVLLRGQLDNINAQAQALDAKNQKEFDALEKQSNAIQSQKQKELAAAKGNASKIAAINQKYAAKEASLEAKKQADKEAYNKKNNEIKHKADVANKEAAMFDIAINTAVAVAKVWGQTGIFGIAAQIPVIAMGVIEEALVASRKLPQYGTGNRIQVLGAGDGQTYNAQLTDSNHQSGLFNEPTYVPGFGLFGETKTPELVFNPYDTQKIMNTPALVQALKFTLGNSQQYASGNAREIIRENNTTQMFTDPALIELMQEIRDYVKMPARAELVADEDYIRTHNRVKNDYENFQKRVGM